MRARNSEERKHELKLERGRRYRAKNKERNAEKNRQRAAAHRLTDAYKEWLLRSRDYRVEWKRNKRRADGALSREQIALRTAERAAERDARRVARNDFRNNFIGPPTPSKAMTDAQYYAWRVVSDPEFYTKELDRAQRYKARTRHGYKDSIIGWSEMPTAMKEVKHLQYLISRQLEKDDK